MAATPSIKFLMQSSYRGGTKAWSNRYHFTGGVPADAAHWLALYNAVVADLKACWKPGETIIEGAIGYNAGSDVPVWSGGAVTACTAPWGGGPLCPLADAALVRYSTTARSSKNHPVYLFNYYHAVHRDPGSDVELLDSPQKSDFLGLANNWVAGYSDGTNTYKRAGPNGATAVGNEVEPYITHRDFPR